ncbi:MAG: DUF5682 family protein [Polyangiales bacterium]
MATSKKGASPAKSEDAARASAGSKASKKEPSSKSEKSKAPASAAASAGPLGRIFGVRHLSPMGALQLEKFIDEVQPTAVVIEGPADADAMIPLLAHKKSKPPLAILSFTQARPVRSILYPLAAYSPEWIAITKGLARKALVRFMDLPAEVFLADNAPQDDEDQERSAPRSDTQAYLDDPYTAIATLTGEPDHDTWWERHFEHNPEPDAYREAIHEFGAQLRALRKDSKRRERETLTREAYMRRVLREVIAEGHAPDKIVVVCGAYHAPVLTAEEHAMTDAELARLPRSPCTHTIMPYSYPRLSAQSGYGAGNNAPAYYQILFDQWRAARPQHVGYRVLSAIAGRLRARGNVRSSAEVIEAARLARALAAMNEQSHAPTLRDLLDGALTCLAYGDQPLLDACATEVVVGDEIGSVAPGVARTSIQDDFYRLVKDLRLDDYLKDKRQPVKGRAKDGKHEALDLREDRRAASAASALRDRNVSIFLHRLSALGVPFARLEYSGSDVDLDAELDAGQPRRWSRRQSTFKESWSAQWTPDCEISLVEGALRGDTIEIAAVRALQERLASCASVGEAAQSALVAMQCELQDAMNAAVTRVRELGVEDGSFASIAAAVRRLSDLTSYGSVRRVDLGPLEPLVSQLFLRATLLLPTAVRGDDAAAREVGEAMGDLQWVALTSAFADKSDGAAVFDEGLVERWWRALDTVADDDAAHGYCAGVANALLLERAKVSDAALDRRIALRISPGLDPNAVGHYFEGLSSRNRMALLSRKLLWRSMTEFIEGLDHDAFRRSVVGLRRAFGTFEVGEARRVAELLTEIWGGGREVATAITGAVESKVDEAELATLNDELEGLDDLDL